MLDYGIGNLRSAEKALQKVGADARLVADPAEARRADAVVLPGVGSFGPCARALRATGLDEVALEAIQQGKPFLGICVGLQLLFDGSEEDPADPGLGLIAGTVTRLPRGVKHPQMQWNRLSRAHDRPSRLFDALGEDPWVYFVHSFAPPPCPETVALCEYGGQVVSAVERDNLWGVQFHPEKSAATGLRFLAGFLETCR